MRIYDHLFLKFQENFAEMNETQPEYVYQTKFLLEGCLLPVVAILGLAGKFILIWVQFPIKKNEAQPGLSSDLQ